jgi:hypothetical protein
MRETNLLLFIDPKSLSIRTTMLQHISHLLQTLLLHQ